MSKVISIPMAEVKIEDDLYPRERVNIDHVNALQSDLENGAILPPIVIDQFYRLVNGRHRFEAKRNYYKSNWESVQIEAEVIEAPEDPVEWLKLAIMYDDHKGLPYNSKDILRISRRIVTASNKKLPDEIAKLLHFTPEGNEEFYRTTMKTLADAGTMAISQPVTPCANEGNITETISPSIRQVLPSDFRVKDSSLNLFRGALAQIDIYANRLNKDLLRKGDIDRITNLIDTLNSLIS